jgi:hypothetical protein
MDKKVGIIGSGVVAQALGKGFLNQGYEVLLGTRDTSKLAEWQKVDGQGSQLGSFEDAAKYSDIIVLAVKGTVAKDAIKLAGESNLAGKTVIDATNPIADSAPENGVLKFFTTNEESLLEQLQSTYPDIHFVKAYNSVGSALMVNPPFDTKPSMFICGNNETAKKEVGHINDLFGWETVDMGTAEAARAIEPLCILWCIPGLRENKWMHAFKLLQL